MQFLVVSTPKDTLNSLPPASRMQLLETTMAVMKQQKKEGHILQYYYSPAGRTVVILNVTNAEDCVKHQVSLPILAHYTQEVYPLADMEEALSALVEASKLAGNAPAGASR